MKKPLSIKQIHPILSLILISLLVLPISFYGIYLYLAPNLPDISKIKVYKIQKPITIYSKDGVSIGQFGEKIAVAVNFNHVPKHQVQAFLAAEDATFFEHSGISVKSLARAVIEAISGDDRQSGGSTITMQVAKNYYLSPERTLSRKLTEVFLARQLEQSLSKKEIFELYINKIFLGHHAYGIAAAAQVYYSKSLDQLTIAEMAMIAGLPKAPSKYNPVNNPARALIRRNWILGRMRQLGFITPQEFTTAIAEPITLNMLQSNVQSPQPYVNEMVRNELVSTFGEDVLESGYKVYTTIDSKLQNAAIDSLQNGLESYDKRHGWRGAEAKNGHLENFFPVAGKIPAQVVGVASNKLDVKIASGEVISIPWSSLPWSQRYVSADNLGGIPASAKAAYAVGDILRIHQVDGHWRLTQIPKVQGQIIALDPSTGAIQALVGGYDFFYSKFNRSTQGWRQAGSTIKPFVYSLALERGFTPDSMVQDAPLTTGKWHPNNSDHRFLGNITLQKALYLSRNLVSIRLLQSVGIKRAHDFLTRFGFIRRELPNNLTLALGTCNVLPVQVATGYAAFANGGYRVQPYFIERIEDWQGKVLFQANPAKICTNGNCAPPPTDNPADSSTITNVTATSPAATTTTAPVTPTTLPVPPATLTGQAPSPSNLTEIKPAVRIMSAKAAYQMANILQNVIQVGTGFAAKSIGRKDIGGKTGTTSNSKDAWFAGFHPSIVAVSWVGFDQPSTLGRREFGGIAALPIWREFMRFALKDKPTQWVSLTDDSDYTININDAQDSSNTTPQGNVGYRHPPLAYQPKRYVPVDETEATDNSGDDPINAVLGGEQADTGETTRTPDAATTNTDSSSKKSIAPVAPTVTPSINLEKELSNQPDETAK